MQPAIADRSFDTLPRPERRESAGHERALGHVVSCSGARATLAATTSGSARSASEACAIGRLVSINLGTRRVVGLVYEVRALQPHWHEGEVNAVAVEIELLGEVIEDAVGPARFQSGISLYPHIGAPAHRIRSGDLALIHDLGQRGGVAIGALSQDPSIPATVNIDDMLARHFAVLGTTGTGKSSAVALLLRKAVAAKRKLRVLILDPHNEYAHAFSDIAECIDDDSLDLPFWMFRFEELTEVVFRGRPPVEDETDILREVIATARQRYRGNGTVDLARTLSSPLLKRPLDSFGGRRAPDGHAAAADPVAPYRMSDVLAAIDELIGLHELRYPRAALRSLRVRLEALANDPRYGFMFARANVIESVRPVISRIFRIPVEGRPITVFQLGGLPSEVVNAVASVLARLAFDLALSSRGGYEILLLCEEAHRYVPHDQALGFVPTRLAIARIAKEGRKYGAYLGVVTQRPGELDPTVLSQCSTIFAMRLANERDQQIIRSAVANASASTVGFLSSIGNREAIAFGEGVATTMRLHFTELSRAELPAMAERADNALVPAQEVRLDDLVINLRGGG